MLRYVELLGSTLAQALRLPMVGTDGYNRRPMVVTRTVAVLVPLLVGAVAARVLVG